MNKKLLTTLAVGVAVIWLGNYAVQKFPAPQ